MLAWEQQFLLMDEVSELAETGSCTKDFVLSFISLAIKLITCSVIQSV